jgi:hypothetical protein
LLTGAVGAALLGQDIAQKAQRNGRPLERKERSLGKVEVF